MVAIGCSFEACLMSLTCKYEILENPMSTVGAPTLNICNSLHQRFGHGKVHWNDGIFVT